MDLYKQFADEIRLMESSIRDIERECDEIAYMLSMGSEDFDE